MRISVGRGDIAHSTRGDSDNCAIACAVRRKFWRLAHAHVTLNEVVITRRFTGTKTIHGLPKAARKFIRRFDNGKPVEPIEFELGDSA